MLVFWWLFIQMPKSVEVCKCACVFVPEGVHMFYLCGQVYHSRQSDFPRHLLRSAMISPSLNHLSYYLLHSLIHRYISFFFFFPLRTAVETEEPELFREWVLMELFAGERFVTKLISAAGERGPRYTISSAVSLEAALPPSHQPDCRLTPWKAACLGRQTGKGLLHKRFPPDQNCCHGLREQKNHVLLFCQGIQML